jgi:sugar O-acyltransferase (sialic acid O-acetyltransferase NeuD family)
MKNLIIIGAGGVGRETVQLVADINRQALKWQLHGFVDDAAILQGQSMQGLPILGTIEWLNSVTEEYWIICAISNPGIKRKIVRRLNNPLLHYATLLHPTAVIASSAKIGIDVIVHAFCFVSVNTKIGNHVQLNPQCGIGHEANIGDFSSLYWNVNVSGSVNIGTDCIIGTKATILQNLGIGDGTIIGSATNVISHLPSNCTAVGNPAKVIKSRN